MSVCAFDRIACREGLGGVLKHDYRKAAWLACGRLRWPKDRAVLGVRTSADLPLDSPDHCHVIAAEPPEELAPGNSSLSDFAW